MAITSHPETEVFATGPELPRRIMQGAGVSQLFLAAGPASKFIDCSTHGCNVARDGARQVTITVFLTLIPMLVGMAGAAAPREEPRVRSFVVQDELILRVPIRPAQRNIEWVEAEGPKCINARAIRSAFLSASDSVDFITVRSRRIRAQLSEECPALDFYDDFYLKPEDEKVCAKRDVIRSRMGGSCRIEQFLWLVPKPRG